MDSKPLNDEERHELNHLREENLALKEEIEELRALLELNQPKQSPPGEGLVCSELEKKIDSLREKVRTHRMEAGGKCWLFGIGTLKFDYGAIWDSTSYWYSLISSSGGSCLANFAYKNLESSCKDCKKTIGEMNKVWDNWRNLKKIEASEPESK